MSDIDVKHELPEPATTPSSKRSIGEFMMEEIDGDQSTWQLTAFCFMTGWIDAVSFSAVFVWCAFQTGNTLQLSLALARLFQPGTNDTSFHEPDKQALTSLLTFLFGAFVGRIGDRMGARTRKWLFYGTFLQALLTMGAAIAVWQSHQLSVAVDRGTPAWTNARTFAALGLMSMSMGLQGIMGKRVNSQFATTIVLTTVWCELVADPKLFNFRHMVKTRDHKVLGIFALFIGGFTSRAILQTIGAESSLGIACGIRVLMAISWLFVPAKKAAPKA
jgi:uncharacterized membrane protein YoaK (UPF0700 family)